MPKRREIKNRIGSDLYSIEVYEPHHFENFSPEREFDKWAAVEVTEIDTVPDEMETITVSGGLYAVFLHKGAANKGHETYGYIFKTWLPDSIYTLDNRPHIAIMGKKYKNEDPDSEEDIWIPIKMH
jgi:AraC family transcriptional regulator